MRPGGTRAKRAPPAFPSEFVSTSVPPWARSSPDPRRRETRRTLRSQTWRLSTLLCDFRGRPTVKTDSGCKRIHVKSDSRRRKGGGARDDRAAGLGVEEHGPG